jgi:hypothetical protein
MRKSKYSNCIYGSKELVMKDRHIYGILILVMYVIGFLNGWSIAAEQGHDKLKACWNETDQIFEALQGIVAKP